MTNDTKRYIILITLLFIVACLCIGAMVYQDEQIESWRFQYNAVSDDYQRFRNIFDKLVCGQPVDSVRIGEITMYFTQPDYYFHSTDDEFDSLYIYHQSSGKWEVYKVYKSRPRWKTELYRPYAMPSGEIYYHKGDTAAGSFLVNDTIWGTKPWHY